MLKNVETIVRTRGYHVSDVFDVGPFCFSLLLEQADAAICCDHLKSGGIGKLHFGVRDRGKSQDTLLAIATLDGVPCSRA